MPNIRNADDPAKVALYSAAEAERYLQIPVSTIRAWFFGMGNFRPVLIPAERSRPFSLSYLNLIEAHVLDAVRRDHKIAMPKVRRSLRYIENHYNIENPLSHIRTDGTDLFLIARNGEINVSREGQFVMSEVVQSELVRQYLPRIKHALDGSVVTFFPFVVKKPLRLTENVEINPSISSGTPVITGTGVRTAILYERFNAGESVDSLAADYGFDKPTVEDAIRYEKSAAA